MHARNYKNNTMRQVSTYQKLSCHTNELELLESEHSVNEISAPASDQGFSGSEIPRDEPSCLPCTSVNVQNPRSLAHTSPKKVIRQPRRLPYWLWYLIAKSLGIKLTPDEKPVFATILYIFTLTSAIGFMFSSTWYSVCSIVVERDSDVLDGTVSILVVGFWCALGVYANKLAYRLFGHRKFLAMLRLHSKTVLKLNAAFVVFFLCTAFIVLHNLSSLPYWIGTPCERANLDHMVCQLRFVSQIVFSVFTLLWNVLVAVVLVSVCRTHTISIRRFILELEQDAVAHNPQLSEVHMSGSDDYHWLDDDYLDEVIDGQDESLPSVTKPCDMRAEPMDRHVSAQVTGLWKAGDSMVRGSVENVDNGGTSVSVNQPACFSNADILQKYWTIMVQLRVSSLALQRWMVSVVSLTIVWGTINLVHWLSHPPQLYEVLNFGAPLLLLPLLCSAYAEVNNEGRQAIQCIRPSEERLMMLQYLRAVPLQLTVFNHAVSYSTIGTAAFGLLLAFVSKILFHEIS